METPHHHTNHDDESAPMHAAGGGLNRLALTATAHCLSGCAIGEVLGMVIGTGFGLANATTIVVSIVLAFVFGYSLTMLPLLRSGLAFAAAVPLALAADTLSIALMELVDNTFMLAVPGAIDAQLTDLLFWASLVASLVIAGAAAFPLNRWLIVRGRGHAVVHGHHD